MDDNKLTITQKARLFDGIKDAAIKKEDFDCFYRLKEVAQKTIIKERGKKDDFYKKLVNDSLEDTWTDFKKILEKLTDDGEIWLHDEKKECSENFKIVLLWYIKKDLTLSNRFIYGRGFERVFNFFLSKEWEEVLVDKLITSENRFFAPSLRYAENHKFDPKNHKKKGNLPISRTIIQRVRSILAINFADTTEEINKQTRPQHKLKMIIELWGDFEIVKTRISAIKHLERDIELELHEYFDSQFLLEFESQLKTVMLTPDERVQINKSGLEEYRDKCKHKGIDVDKAELDALRPEKIDNKLWKSITLLLRYDQDTKSVHLKK